MRELLGEVAEILRQQGVHGRLYVVGGAAMALAYDAMRTTKDLDSVILKGRGTIIAAAHQVASRHGLPQSWLNEQASAYVPPGPDAQATVVFDAPNLVVLAASPARLFTMKAQAARAADVEDIHTLAALLDIVDLPGALAVCGRVMPDQPLSVRSNAVLGEIFGQGRADHSN